MNENALHSGLSLHALGGADSPVLTLTVTAVL